MNRHASIHSEPDGVCHAALATVLLSGCGNPAPGGQWSCDRHAVELYQRGRELIDAAAEREGRR